VSSDPVETDEPSQHATDASCEDERWCTWGSRLVSIGCMDKGEEEKQITLCGVFDITNYWQTLREMQHDAVEACCKHKCDQIKRSFMDR
jgi:hypothetical protein